MRIGRTARAGAEGKAINILSSKDYDNFSQVLKENDVEIREETVPAFEKVVVRTPERRPNKPFVKKGQQRNRRRRLY